MAAAAGVLVVAGAHLAVGWYVSSNLHDGLLVVGPKPEEPPEVRVREIGHHEIALESPVPRQDIGHPGTLALVWEGGRATVGDVVSAGDGLIWRKYKPGVNGPPPVCHGRLLECPPVVLDAWMYAPDPGDAGLEFTETTYDGPLGRMGAWAVPAGDGSRWAVLVHGWTADRREMIRMAKALHRSGVSSLIVDYRNDEGNPTDPTGRYRFGLSEWEDIEAAIAHTISLGADDVLLAGASTGGAIAMSVLERSSLVDSVKGLILDAPNLILVETVRWSTSDRKVPTLMFEFGLWLTDLRWKVDWEATNYVQRADETLTVPTLVFHGTSDQTVPISVSRQLEARNRRNVRLVEVPAAGHVMSWNADPDMYESEIARFAGAL